MAHKKGAGSSRNGRDSNSQRLGVKKYGGELVRPGHILVRQRGSRIQAGENVRMGKDDTLYAVALGRVTYRTVAGGRKRVSVEAVEMAEMADASAADTAPAES